LSSITSSKLYFSCEKGTTTFDRKRIYANPSSYPNTNPDPKAQLCFRTDEMTSFFDQVYQYREKLSNLLHQMNCAFEINKSRRVV